MLVLYQQPLDDTGKHRRTLKQITIHRQLGIPEQQYTPTDRLVPGILDLLNNEGYVKPFGGGYWGITKEGVSVIEG